MTRRITWVLALLVLVAGCRTASPGKGDGARPNDPRLNPAEQRFAKGDYQGAIASCIDLMRIDPQMPGLADLQARVITAVTEERVKAATLRQESSRAQMLTEMKEDEALPANYGRRLHTHGATGSLRTPPSAIETVLKKPVTVHLEEVDLGTFILAMSGDKDINIVADSSLNTLGSFTIHAENTPLKEILDYIGRNLGVTFSVGENLVWATAGTTVEAGPPLETRLYKLRKGLVSSERGGRVEQDAGGAMVPTSPAPEGASPVRVVEAIDRLVPKVTGSDTFFDSKAHLLLVRNTAENLALAEDVIDELDVSPPQVLIEARFISTGVSDLRELGIDWVLNSPLVISDTALITDSGESVTAPRTVIERGSSFTVPPTANAANGLNMTYKGILTDPMFQAVLHALEVSGKSRTLSAPKVTTVNNQSATIRIGEDFRYFEEYAVQSVPSSVTDNGTQVYTSVVLPTGLPTLEELGISLNVTPSVGADRSDISLELTPEISEFVRYETYEVSSRSTENNNGNNVALSTNSVGSVLRLPIFRRSKIQTEMIVRSGETVVMGGMIISAENNEVSGIPILSSIPLIGKLFQHQTVEEESHNLLIFVTATLLSESGDSLVPLTKAGN